MGLLDSMFGSNKNDTVKFKSKNYQHNVTDSQKYDHFNERDRLRRKRTDSNEPNKSATQIQIVLIFIGLLFSFTAIIALLLSTLTQLPNGLGDGFANYAGIHSFWSAFWVTLNPLGLGFWALLKDVVLYGLTIGVTIAVAYRVSKIGQNNRILDEANQYLNDYEGEPRLVQPEEILSLENVEPFPDVGAHADVEVTAMISHLMTTDDGINKIRVAKRYKKDTKGEDEFGNEIIHKKGEIVYDANGDYQLETKPMFDKKLGEEIYDVDELDKDDISRHWYNPKHLDFNPKKRFGKSNEATVAEFINNKFYWPIYEVQRPAGVYAVDTAPNNTMVLAMTRAGKGQTIINPTIDMWTRQKHPQNMMINDPKGELYTEFNYPASIRGFDVIAFNLINPRKTSIYNPLGYAVDASRHGNTQQVEEFVNDIGNTFFPVGKDGDDPMWPNAANSTFKRTAKELISLYQDKENYIRYKSLQSNMDRAVLENQLNEMWRAVTLYNCYQMMTQLASKKSANPDIVCITEEERDHADKTGKVKAKDYLTLLLDAERLLPRNRIRLSIASDDDSLRTMAGSEKTIASVYGIALTSMKFFSDDVISRLTSGGPLQNFDMQGLGFPRRIQIRMESNYMDNFSFRAQHYKWSAYRDAELKNKYEGPDFEHEGDIDDLGWLSYYFKGIFDQPSVYLQLEIFDATSGNTMQSFYFKFTKSYETTADGIYFVEHPITHERIISGGSLVECQLQGDTLVPGDTTYPKLFIPLSKKDPNYGQRKQITAKVFNQIDVHYTEKPKAIFLITPPHLMNFSKIILVMINQAFNQQVAMSYMTKANQKPLYKTRYMLDEVGNLQSDGKGIMNLQTKESIGLGQEQQYTLILQTVQQLKDIYGDSIDKILQGNTGNIHYIKSPELSMLDQLSQLSGKRHVVHRKSLTNTKDNDKMMNQSEGKMSITASLEEEPVISKNQLLNMPNKGSSIMFGHGNPIFNTQAISLPYAAALHKNNLRDLHHEYSLASMPSINSDNQLDVSHNIPDFFKIVERRVKEARMVPAMKQAYMECHGLDELQFNKKDFDATAQEIMVNIDAELDASGDFNEVDLFDDDQNENQSTYESQAEENQDFNNARKNTEKMQEPLLKKRFAAGDLSRADLLSLNESGTLITENAKPNHDLDVTFANAYADCVSDFKTNGNFQVTPDNSLLASDGTPLIISSTDPQYDYHNEINLLANAADDSNNKEMKHTPDGNSANMKNPDEQTAGYRYKVTDQFYRYFAAMDNWNGLFNGKFDTLVSQYLNESDN